MHRPAEHIDMERDVDHIKTGCGPHQNGMWTTSKRDVDHIKTGCGPQACAGLDVRVIHCGSSQRTVLTKIHNTACFILHVEAM